MPFWMPDAITAKPEPAKNAETNAPNADTNAVNVNAGKTETAKNTVVHSIGIDKTPRRAIPPSPHRPK